MAQKCFICHKPLKDGIVMIKCPAYFENFTDVVHRVIPQDVEEIFHIECDEGD